MYNFWSMTNEVICVIFLCEVVDREGWLKWFYSSDVLWESFRRNVRHGDGWIKAAGAKIAERLYRQSRNIIATKRHKQIP